MLGEGVDGAALVAPERLLPRRASIGEQASKRWAPSSAGDTTYLCTVDEQRMGVSLIQSNASGFGSWIVEQKTGINLHNRGMGFSVEAGHPGEIVAGRRKLFKDGKFMQAGAPWSIQAVDANGAAGPRLLEFR